MDYKPSMYEESKKGSIISYTRIEINYTVNMSIVLGIKERIVILLH